MISKHTLLITFLNEAELMFFNFYQIRIILYTIYHLFALKFFHVLLYINNNSIIHQ